MWWEETLQLTAKTSTEIANHHSSINLFEKIYHTGIKFKPIKDKAVLV